MAISTEDQTKLHKVNAGLFNAAAGATFLPELEAAYEVGVTQLAYAELMATNAVFTDTILGGSTDSATIAGILSSNFGLPADNVEGSAATQAIAFFTAGLDGGRSAGDLVSEAVDYLSGSPAAEFAEIATLLSNKAAVAAAYSAVKLSGDITELQAVLSTVTGAAALTQEEIDTIVDEAPGELVNDPEFSLASGIDAIEAAEDAVADFLLEIAQDPDVEGEEPALTEAEVADALYKDVDSDGFDADDTGATTVTGALVFAAGASTEFGYAAASTAVQAALISDAETANATALTEAQDALDAANEAAAEVVGLTDAIATLTAAGDATKAAALVVGLEATDYAAAELIYNNAADDAADETLFGAAGTYITDIDDIGALVQTVAGSETGELELVDGITETTNPGITELMAAAQAYNDAVTAHTAAVEAEDTATAVVENLDPTPARGDALALLGEGFSATTPADADAPTVAEIEAETASLDALLTTADAAAAVLVPGDTLTDALFDIDAAMEALIAGGDPTTSKAALAAITTQSVTDGTLTAANKTAIDTAYNAAYDGSAVDDLTDHAAGEAAAQLALAANNADQAVTDFGILVGIYDAEAGATPLATAVTTKEGLLEAAEDAITDLAEAVANQAEAQANVDALEALNDAITDALDVFETEGLETPVQLDSAVKAATTADDIFYEGSIDSQILSFGLLGEDSLVIGTEYTLNADEVAGDNGNDAVLEAWLTEDGADTVVTLETSVFGSNAATAETIEITLTGVDLADVTLAGGVITVA